MNVWALPAAAGAFWAGLLAWEVHPAWARPWMGMTLGLAALAGAWLAAPRTASGHDPLTTIGLAEPGPAAVGAVRRPHRIGGSPLTAIALTMIGLVLLGAGWSGFHAAWLDDSLLARLAPQRVSVVGTLHTDPEVGAFGWHATLDVTRVEWPGAAASLRASLWLSDGDHPPPWVRGDVIFAEGVLRRPDDPGFQDALAHKGMIVELNGSRVERLGPSPSPFIRAAQVFRAFVGRSIARLFPAKEAGLLLGLALGDASRLDPGMMRDFQASGLGHLLVVSGEKIAYIGVSRRLPPTMNVAIYTRLSRDMDGHQTATARQEKDCRALARSKGWKVAQVYEDIDFSAFKRGVRRPAYERLLEDLGTGAIQGVVIWKLDRLMRRASEFERFWSVCEAANATLAAVNDPIDTSSEVGMVVVRVLVAFAQLEAANTSTRIRSQVAERAQNGGMTVYGGRRPFGFEADRKTIRPEEAEHIREAARRVVSGESMTSISRQWNEAGVLTTAGGKWMQTTLRRVLASPRVAGLLEHKGTVVGDAPWPAIIDRKTWEQLRAVLERRRGDQPRFGPRAHVLVGLARCGRCGAKLSALAPWGRRRTVTYVCPMPSSGRGCGRIAIAGPNFESFVKDAAFKVLASPATERAVREASSGGHDAELVNVVTEGRRALEALDDDLYDGRLDRSRWQRQTSRITERIERAQRQLANSTRSAVLADLPASRELLERRWDESDVAWRAELLGSVIERVVVNPPKRPGRFDPERIDPRWRF